LREPLLDNSGPRVAVACAAARRDQAQRLIVASVGDAPTLKTIQPNAAPYRRGIAMLKRTIVTLGFLAVAGAAQAGTKLNALSANALTENGLSLNGFSPNGLELNTLTSNALTQNALSTNIVSLNALVENGVRLNSLHARRINIDATRADRSRHNGLRVVDVELPAASTNEK
jgi:hypothetical protein